MNDDLCTPPHPLRAWRESQNPRVTIRRLAEMLDAATAPVDGAGAADTEASFISSASIARIEQGLQPPSIRLMRAAEKVTGGAVTPSDFVRAYNAS